MRILLSASMAVLCLALAAGCSEGVSSNNRAAEIVVHVEASPEIGPGPLEVELSAVVVDYPGSTSSLEYTWDFGDGSDPATGATVSHVFTENGSFTASVTVRDGDLSGTASKVIDVGPIGPGVDLAVTGLEATPAAVNPGSALSVKLTVENRGSSALAGETVVRLFVLPLEELPSQPGTPTGVVTLAGLQGGEIHETIASALVPALFDEGEYWVFAVVDGDGDIEEFDEENNVARTALAVTVTDDLLPVDLVVESVSTSVTSPAAAGSTLPVAVVVRNQGTQASPASKLALRLSVDPTVQQVTADPALALVGLPSIPAGGSHLVEHAATLPATLDNRPWYLGAIADASATVSETNESNNTGVAGDLLLVQGGTGCTEDSSEPNETSPTAITLAAGNYTSLAVCPGSTDWYRVTLAAGDTLTATAAFEVGNGNLDLALFRDPAAPAIAVSNGTTGTESVSSGVAVSAGDHFLRVSVASSAAGVPYTLSLAVSPSGGEGKDLVPANFVVAPTNVMPGAQVNVSFSVHNFGDEDVTTGTTANVRLSADATYSAVNDHLLKGIAVGTIPAGGSADFTATLTIPADTAMGTWYLVMRVDALSAVAETYEDNNVAVALLGVGTGCGEDLFEENDSLAAAKPIASVQLTGLRSCAGDEDWFSIQVPAGGTVEVDALFSDAEGNISLYLVNANGSTVKSSLSSTDDEHLVYTAQTAGTFYVRVRLAADDGTIDGNGYTLLVDGAIGAAVDLSPIAVTFTPASAYAGEEVQVVFDLRNLSTTEASATYLSIRLSVDTTIDGADVQVGPTLAVPALPAGSRTTFTRKFIVPASATGTSRFVGVYADSTGLLSESSEANNGASSATQLTVPVPCSDDSREDNDNAEQPSSISLGTTYSLVACANDPDWFRATASSAANLTARIEFTNANGDLDLHLYDATGTTLMAYSSSATQDVEEVTIAASAGASYLVRVSGFNGAGNTYTLRASQ